MSLNKIGLICGTLGALFGALDTWVRIRGIGVDSISVGHGATGSFWRILGILSYLFLFVGFILQFLGSS